MITLGALASIVIVSASSYFIFFEKKGDHFSIDSETQIGYTPEQIDRVAWEWDTPEGHSIVTVMPGPAGPVVVMERGVIGLDGTTGEELWGYQSDLDGSDVSASVTPDGQYALIAEVRDGLLGERNHVSLLDTATGEIQKRYRYSPDSRFPNLLNLSDHNWIEAHDRGIVARDLYSGDITWEYQPDPACGIQMIYETRTFEHAADYSVATSGDHYAIAELCRDRPDEIEPDSPHILGDLVVLDTQSGDISWTSEDDILLKEVTLSELEVPYSASINVSRDETALLAETSSGSTIFDLATGEVVQDDQQSLIQEDWESSRIVDFTNENMIVAGGEFSKNELPEFSNLTMENGDSHDKTSSIKDYYDYNSLEYHRTRPTDSFSYSLPLEKGIITTGCTGQCNEDRSNDAILFAPWDRGQSDMVIVSENIDWIFSDKRALFLEAPGSVILYQTGSGGSIIGLA
ncbi:hypothetical protein ABZ645_16905 [Nocardiopsis alba]|uniref:hypothetical protein n=1 Tax=Nocardiopsis alba TaxID=53437 RepID=UPI0033F2F05A